MTVPETTLPRRIVWPGDYYSSATPNPVLPSWATYGCGGLAALMIVLIFAGGAYLAGGGFSDFMDLAIGMSVSEAKGMYASDVSAGQKQSLDAEIATMRKNLREGALSVQRLQPFLDTMRKVTSDSKVTGAEAATLEETAKKANSAAKVR
jgi:hypothetical protein